MINISDCKNLFNITHLVLLIKERIMRGSVQFIGGEPILQRQTYNSDELLEQISKCCNISRQTVDMIIKQADEQPYLIDSTNRLTRIMYVKEKLRKEINGEPGIHDIAESCGCSEEMVCSILREESNFIKPRMIEVLNQTLRLIERCEQNYGQEPTILEIASKKKWSSEKAQSVLNLAKVLVHLQKNNDVIPFDNIQSMITSEIIKKISYDEVIDRNLRLLNAKEKLVMEILYGLRDSNPQTPEEVGRHFNVTPTRILQIRTSAIRKLRHPKRVCDSDSGSVHE